MMASDEVRYVKLYDSPDKEQWTGFVSLVDDDDTMETAPKFLVKSNKAIKVSSDQMSIKCRNILSKSTVSINMKEVEMAMYTEGTEACCYYVWWDKRSHTFNGIIGLCRGKEMGSYEIKLDKNARSILKQNEIIELSRTLKRKYEQYVHQSTGLWVPWILPYQQEQGWQYWNCKTENCIGCGITKAEFGSSLKVCCGCRSTRYCSRHCQKIHWKNYHRAECSRLYS